MSDQNGGKAEAGETDPAAPIAQSAEDHADHHAAPAIEGEAVEIQPESAPEQAAQRLAEDLEADPAPVSNQGAEASASDSASVAQTPRRGGALLPVAILIGAVAVGGGAYYLWNGQEAPLPPRPASAPAQSSSTMMAPAPPPSPPPVPAPPKMAEAPAVKPQPTPAPAPVSAPAASASTVPATDKTVADLTAKLAAINAEVARLTEKLKSVESQLAAPKDDSRATTAARENGSSGAGDAAARLVVAQSLLAALRQGDDFSAQLAALQNFGANPARISALRAGLAAPSANRLAADFSALAPKLASAAAPPASAGEPKTAASAPVSILGRLEAEARKLVRIRPANAPDKDAAESQIDKIEQDLRAGDLGAALADRQLLPAPALALSADWASAAQARIDAEAAAKAELAEALQNLVKTKS